MTQSILLSGNTFVMHPTGSLFWKERSMLLISDVHLGKISHFRKFGAAVPQKAIHRNFELMDNAIAFFSPQNIVFLGDLFHSSLNKEWELFEEWTAAQTANMVLVVGNHDIISPLKYEVLGIRVLTELQVDGFLFTHHPEERKDLFVFAGHIHPAVRLQGTGRQSIRLSCFLKMKNQMILPAFGTFTGSHVLDTDVDDEIFVTTRSEVLKISG